MKIIDGFSTVLEKLKHQAEVLQDKTDAESQSEAIGIMNAVKEVEKFYENRCGAPGVVEHIPDSDIQEVRHDGVIWGCRADFSEDPK